MSFIEAQLARLKQEHEERKSLRQNQEGRRAEHHVSEAAHAEAPGVFAITEERRQEVQPRLAGREDATATIRSFDFENAPVAEFIDMLIIAALSLRASDLHCEPEQDAVRLRYRVDGLLYNVGFIPASFYRLMLSRVKLLGGMKLNSDTPQDGRFAIRAGQKNSNARLSSVPSQYGETLVIRFLDPETIALSLEDLGMRADDLIIINEEIAAPNGMILNTGPTGSGKTTTLYAFLKKRQTPELKIITIEDPIEYHLPGIEQTQTTSDGSYTFTNGLRAIVRQDPDIILIGEIRDGETAGIALQAALTGHLVFTTIHANEAAGAIPRLLDLGIQPVSIGPALNLIMAQRLVRRLCEQCRAPVALTDDLRASLVNDIEQLPARVERSPIETITLFEARGCGACDTTGYRGRVGIFELLRVDEDIERLIEQRVSETDLRRFAIERGMVTMRQDGVYKALCGITTLAEVAAATGQRSIEG